VSATAPFVVGRVSMPKTSCTGRGGSVSSKPGLVLKVKKSRKLTLSGSFTSCTGTFVSVGHITASVQTSTAVNCTTAMNVTSGGSGTFTWNSPLAMGTSDAHLRLVVVSTVRHVTKIHVYGTITAKANIFTGRHITGTITLNRGLSPRAAGGDCSAKSPLTKIAITSIKLALN